MGIKGEANLNIFQKNSSEMSGSWGVIKRHHPRRMPFHLYETKIFTREVNKAVRTTNMKIYNLISPVERGFIKTNITFKSHILYVI